MSFIKRFWISIEQTFRRYRTLSRRVNQLTDGKSSFKSIGAALLIAFIILLPLALIAINLFIYSKLTFLLAIILFFIVLSYVVIYFSLYYRFLLNYNSRIIDLNLNFLKTFEIILVNTIMIIIGITALFIIF